MNDRELLEAAARAAGYVVARVADDGVSLMLVGVQDPWNPRDDDGDAMRLAVKLRIAVRFDDNAPPELGMPRSCAYAVHGRAYAFEAPINGDENAATRRAITRAAAAMGEGRA